MKYVLNHSNYADFSVFELQKLPPRSYFIPFPDRAAADAAKLIVSGDIHEAQTRYNKKHEKNRSVSIDGHKDEE